jgi:hypothetical protein
MMGLMLGGTLTAPGVHAGKKLTTNNRTASKPQNLFFMLLPP